MVSIFFVIVNMFTYKPSSSPPYSKLDDIFVCLFCFYPINATHNVILQALPRETWWAITGATEAPLPSHPGPPRTPDLIPAPTHSPLDPGPRGRGPPVPPGPVPLGLPSPKPARLVSSLESPD